MIVLKFGGSSVKDAERMQVVKGIVEARLARQPLVVLSAMGGVTDQLLALATDAARGAADPEPLAGRHRAALRELGLDDTLVDPLLAELADLVRGISLIRELTPRTLDRVASYGERLVVRIFAALLAASGIPAQALDSWDLDLATEDRFGGARFLADDGRARAAFQRIRGVGVVTGYIGRNRKGEVTTLGRGGSDYSAAAIGAVLGAEEIQIWTDVDGVLTADPKLLPQARLIEVLSFDEASEVAYYGAKVLHPATIQPAVLADIPVRVLNTYRPDCPGTLIVRQAVTSAQVAKAVTHKRRVILINIVSTRMLDAHGFLARIFEIFARHQVVIDMVATSEVSVSVTCDREDNLEPALAELAAFSEITVERDRAIVCVVGHGMRESPGVAGRVFGALARAGVNVRMISQGATKINIAFIVADSDVERTTRVLHDEFFG